MDLSFEQVQRLKEHCESVCRSAEGGITFLLLEALRVPAGATPSTVDALLRLGDSGDGYATRLFLAEKVTGPSKIAVNWNALGVRILERNWYAYSWKVPIEIDLDEILREHLKALR